MILLTGKHHGQNKYANLLRVGTDEIKSHK